MTSTVTSTTTESLDPAAKLFLESPVRLHINGVDVASANGAQFTSLDPANGQTLANVMEAGPADVDAAVVAARQALENPSWRKMSPRDRAQLLFRLADLLEEHAEELAQLESLDSGKPLANARKTDIPQSADHIRYFAGWATKIEGATIPSSQGDHFVYTRREPVGVCALIVPWNYPLLMASWKIAPALACGNTIILKPAEQTPLTAARLGQLATEAGFPAGVFNVLQGRGEVTGKALAAHPGIDKVAFTGSTAVGKEIMAVAAKSLTRVSLELGGKSPNLIFADADIESAIGGAGWGIFYNMGEDCCAGSRIFVERPVYDEVVAGLAKLANTIPVGPGFTHEQDRSAHLVRAALARGRLRAWQHRGRWARRSRRWSAGRRSRSRLLLRANRHNRLGQSIENCSGGSFRTSGRGHTVLRRGRSIGPRERHALRTRLGRVDE